MARHNGPVKGTVVFSCEDIAETATFILEPLILSEADYATMLAGGTFTGSMIQDGSVWYAEITNGSIDTVSITDVVLGVGDASETEFTGTMTALPVKTETLTVTAGAVTGTDDGEGAITGTGISAGTVNYTTGAISVTLDAAAASETPVTVDYTRGE